MSHSRTTPIAELNDEIIACRRCPRLVEWREQVAREKRAAFKDETYWGKPVPGFGDHNARLLIVGLAPAAHGANRTGRIFTGDRSGDWLYRALWRAGYANKPTAVSVDDGLVLSDAYVTSPVRCAPPANRPTIAERDSCRPFLDQEFSLLNRVEVVVALGAFGFGEASRVLSIRPRPKFGQAVEYEAPGGETLIGCYHVSQQNTFTGRLTEGMLDEVFERARQITGA